ncbi:MAG: hypothetical protein V1659_02310 [Candidatus Woesearchaeota archaeon]
MTGAFCEMYGNSIRNQVLEFLLENQDLDFSVGDMAKELGISKPKAYEAIYDFEKKCLVRKTRVVGKTQLYALEKNNSRVKLFLYDFKKCLHLVLEEHRQKKTAGNPHLSKGIGKEHSSAALS